MSETPSQPRANTSRPTSGPFARYFAWRDALEQRAWFRWSRRVINLAIALVLGSLLVLSATPRMKLEPDSRTLLAHDALVKKMRKVSLSQTWKMYAPDPSRGHFYLELYAHDADGEVRKLEDSYMAEHGWGTAWAWRRSRLDIWQHAVTRRIDKVNRNRTWYMRGVCVREARRGHEVDRLEMRRIYRRVRPPEQVREGKPVLGPKKKRKAQDGSCHVKIIREMIETDPVRLEAEGQ